MFIAGYLGNGAIVSKGKCFDKTPVAGALIGHDIDIPGHMGEGRSLPKVVILFQCGDLGNFCSIQRDRIIALGGTRFGPCGIKY